jgi:hypothetical protein
MIVEGKKSWDLGKQKEHDLEHQGAIYACDTCDAYHVREGWDEEIAPDWDALFKLFDMLDEKVKILVQIEATIYKDGKETGGFRTHVINLSNKEALDKLVEHYQGPALDDIGLQIHDFIVYDPEVDDKLL